MILMPYLKACQKIGFSVFLALVLFPTFVFSQINSRIYSNEFLAIGVGARAQGMANAFTASTNDVYSVYWNPAGLAHMESDMQIGLQHSEYFEGIANYDFGAASFKLADSSAIGFGIVRLAVDDIPNTLFLVEADGSVNYDNVSSFSVADYAFFLSYGRNLGNLSVGGSAKVVHRIAGPFATAWGFGIDAGIQYHAGMFTFSAMARDVSSTFNAWNITLTDEEKDVFRDTGNEIPENSIELTLPRLIIGAAFHSNLDDIFGFGENIGVRAEINFNNTIDGKRNTLIKTNSISIDPQMGFEFDYKKLVFLRAGVGNFQQETYFDPRKDGKRTTFQPNAGIGLKFQYISIDYAFSDITNSSIAPYSNTISVKFDLSKALFKANMNTEEEAEG